MCGALYVRISKMEKMLQQWYWSSWSRQGKSLRTAFGVWTFVRPTLCHHMYRWTHFQCPYTHKHTGKHVCSHHTHTHCLYAWWVMPPHCHGSDYHLTVWPVCVCLCVCVSNWFSLRHSTSSKSTLEYYWLQAATRSFLQHKQKPENMLFFLINLTRHMRIRSLWASSTRGWMCVNGEMLACEALSVAVENKCTIS